MAFRWFAISCVLLCFLLSLYVLLAMRVKLPFSLFMNATKYRRRGGDILFCAAIFSSDFRRSWHDENSDTYIIDEIGDKCPRLLLHCTSLVY